MSMILNILDRLSRWIRTLAGISLIIGGAVIAVAFGWCRVYVHPDECLVLIAKSGSPLPSDQSLAEPGQKGIQRTTLGPGRHFINPIFYETRREKLVEIKAGRPDTWQWAHTVSRLRPERGPGGNIIGGDFPEVGVLVRQTGKEPPRNEPVPLDSPYKGIIREVLPPGTYRINPNEFKVEKVPALVIPAGFVGVVTNQVGDAPEPIEVPDISSGDEVSTQPSTKVGTKKIRPLAQGNQRGTLSNVFPPGVYFVNPYVQRVKISEVGFNEFSQTASHTNRDTIRFPSKSGFDIELGVTVVWGLHPRHAADVINEFGTTDEVLDKVIKPQLRSICRNEGSLYEARDFIQGDKREEFQRVLTNSLHDVCARKNIELLLALISTIEVYSQSDAGAAEFTDLKKEIQDSFIAIEQQITNVKLQEAAKKKALLEEARKKVDVSRETIQAETRKRVATIIADGARKAAEIEAQARLTVADVERQIAVAEAEKTQLLGKAQADVQKLKQQAEADGRRMLVEALGSGTAYNLYTFANNFEPESIRLFFAGEGTFWTDLNKFEEIGPAQMLKQNTSKSARPAGGKPKEKN